MEKSIIKIRIMGLRNLKSNGITAFKRAFLVFDAASLNKNVTYI